MTDRAAFAGFSPELRLLLSCGNQRPDEQQTALIRSRANADIDWPRFLQLGDRHRVVPHAFLALSAAAADLVPDAVLARLNHRFRRNAMCNMRVTGELARIAQALKAAEIPLMCLKGPALAVQIYGNLQCRQYRDLDLMVPQEHVVQAAQLLHRLDYIELETAFNELRLRQQRRLMRHHKDLVFVSKGAKGVLVELHWRLADHHAEVPLSSKRAWSENGTVDLGTFQTQALEGAANVVFLAWHGGTHKWKRLSWLFDLSQAIRSQPELDWHSVLEIAADGGASKYVSLGLRMVQQLTGVVVPSWTLNRFSLEAEVTTSCRALQSSDSGSEEFAGEFAWKWQMTEKLRHRFGAMRHSLAPRIEDSHRTAPLAYWRRLKQLGQRSQASFSAQLRKQPTPAFEGSQASALKRRAA